MTPTKIAIIGAGHTAQTNHIPYYQSYKRPVEIVALCARDPERTKTVAKKFGIEKSFTDLGKMLAECKPDLVSVCSPNASHPTHVLQSLEAGCHVLCEKPPAISYKDAEEMNRKAQEVNRLLFYNFQNRQLKEAQVLKQFQTEGGFGNIYHIKASFLRRRGIPGWGNFTNKEIQGGGAMMDIGVHILDLALYFLGYPEIKTVLASMYDHIGKKGGVGLMGSWRPENFSVEDACFAQLNFKNNTSITIETAFALNTKADKYFNLEIYGTRSGASLQPLSVYTEKANELADIQFPFSGEINQKEKNIHQFIDACLGEKNNICTAGEGAQLQKIVAALYHSAENKMAVSFD